MPVYCKECARPIIMQPTEAAKFGPAQPHRDDCSRACWEKLVAAEAERDALRKVSELQDKMLVCYRLGKNPGSVIDRLTAAREALAKIVSQKEVP